MIQFISFPFDIGVGCEGNVDFSRMRLERDFIYIVRLIETYQ